MPLHRLWPLASLLLLAAPAASDTSPRPSLALVAQWNFDPGNACDSSGSGAHGTSHGVVFRNGTAVFDGNARIEFPVRPADLRLGYRMIEIDLRAQLDNPGRYYSTLVSHPLYTIAIHALGSTKGRPCFQFAGLVSHLAPEAGDDRRWGKGPRLTDKTDGPFFYWGWLGDGSVVIPPATWVTLRTVYDRRAVSLYVDGKLAATHTLRNPGAFVRAPELDASSPGIIGNYWRDVGADTAFLGAIDYIRVRAAR